MSGCPDPDLAVKQFLEVAGFADKEKSVEIIRGNYVVRYTLDGPKTLTELRRVLNHMAKGLFSEATKAAVRNLKERPLSVLAPQSWGEGTTRKTEDKTQKTNA